MQNSLCGDRGGLRFNIHADLEEMLITGLDNLHFRLILLPRTPPPPLPSCALGFLQPTAAAGAGPRGQDGWGLLSPLAEPASASLSGGVGRVGSYREELPELLGHLDGK